MSAPAKNYIGRLAPTPSGHMHLGHARTFWTAQERARAAGGKLLMRIEDLDRDRCRPEFIDAALEDLAWFGLEWSDAPVIQSQRMEPYRQAFEKLRQDGCLFPCTCSRQDVLRALNAPHIGEDEPLYPGTCWPEKKMSTAQIAPGARVSWRFRVPAGEAICFDNGGCGRQEFVCGRDFGDFIVWRHDGLPSYQLAVTVDDMAMGITEVVRGEDLLASTARQILLYRALGANCPAFFHCPLVVDASGKRLAKRQDSLSLRKLRGLGFSPEELRKIPVLDIMKQV